MHAVSGPPPPDLSGSAACGTTTCGSGELCVYSSRDGSDGSAHPIESYGCVTPSASCPLAACNYSCSYRPGSDCCPACIVGVCAYGIVSYDGERDISCYGY